jgi:hypothetical protein
MDGVLLLSVRIFVGQARKGARPNLCGPLERSGLCIRKVATKAPRQDHCSFTRQGRCLIELARIDSHISDNAKDQYMASSDRPRRQEDPLRTNFIDQRTSRKDYHGGFKFRRPGDTFVYLLGLLV